VLWGARRGPEARAASLRGDAKLWLLRLAIEAQREARSETRDLGALKPLLEGFDARLQEYCGYVRRELEPRLSERGTVGTFEHFERRTRDELAQLSDHISRAPRSAGVAHRVFATACMWVGELDAQDYLVAKPRVGL
jgi:hypothetical protein